VFDKVLVVCIGNICRSPTAEYLLRERLRGRPTTVDSAGLAALAGKPNIPVFRGAEKPLAGTWTTIEDIHGQNGIGGATIPDGPNGSRGSAVEALVEILSAAPPDSQTLVLLGPQTNLALALEQKPDIVRAIKEIVLMAGSLGPENGNASRYAEFNVHVDPKAADIVLGCGRPMFWAPLEVARQASVDRMWIDLLRTIDRPCCSAGADMLEFYLQSFKKPAAALYDPLAVMWLIAPNLFDVTGTRLEIETADAERAGHTRFKLGEGNGTIRVAVSCDADRIRTLLLERLAQL